MHFAWTQVEANAAERVDAAVLFANALGLEQKDYFNRAPKGHGWRPPYPIEVTPEAELTVSRASWPALVRATRRPQTRTAPDDVVDEQPSCARLGRLGGPPYRETPGLHHVLW